MSFDVWATVHQYWVFREVFFGLYSRLMRMSGRWLSERSCGPLFVKLVVKICGFIITEVIQDQAIHFLKIVFR